MCLCTTPKSSLPAPPAACVPWQTCPTCDGSLGSEALKWEARRLPGQAIGKYTQRCTHCGAGYVAKYRLSGAEWRFMNARLVEPGHRTAPDDDEPDEVEATAVAELTAADAASPAETAAA